MLSFFHAIIPPRTAETFDAIRDTPLFGPDFVFRGPATSTIPVFPLSDGKWTISSVHTSDVTSPNPTYLVTSTPGAVTNFVQIFAITVLVDCRPLVLFFSDRIVAKILLLYLSCFSVGIESEC